MVQRQLQFCVAGLDVTLQSSQPDGLASLAGFYEQYPPSGAASGVILDIERVPGFARGRSQGPQYPGFSCKPAAPGRLVLSRFDAEGDLVIAADEPVRGRFRVGESPNTLEAVVRIALSVAMPRHGGLILHASAVAIDHQAHVFAGVSGAGKSTIATLLTRAHPDRIKLSDELVIVKPDAAGRITAHVTPFIGGLGLPHNTAAPVAGVHFLVQAPEHKRTRLPVARALPELMRHVLAYVAEPATASHILTAAGRVVTGVACHRLEFAPDPGVAAVLRASGES